MNLRTTRMRGRPRNRWQNEVRGDGRIVGGEGWQEKVHNREEWKKLLKTARNRQFLHMPSGVPREGGFGVFKPPPKFRSFDKAAFDCKLSRKYLVFLFQHPN